MESAKPVIGFILPCYNEQQVIGHTSAQLLQLLSGLKQQNVIDGKSFIAFVDDGSRDRTWSIIEELSLHPDVRGLKLAAIAGHQKALLAGLVSFMEEADALISMDADLQDDLSVIEPMIQKFANGTDVVYGVRRERKKDTWFKRNSAVGFYKVMKRMGVNLVHNHADFRLQSRRALLALSQFSEVNLFLRGIIPSIGYTQDIVFYDRLDRHAGESKYPLGKMMSFAWNGITSFSTIPLKFVTVTGFVIFLLCLAMSAYSVVALFMDRTIPGWVSTVLPMYFLGGIQLLCVGILGEYVGKIYSEVKRRPRFIIEKRIG